LSVEAKIDESSWQFWLPTPRPAGRYFVNVQIFSPGGSATLDTIKTATFPGLEQGGFRIEVNFRVLKAGTGDGRVVSSPPGLDCGARCTLGVAFGTRVTLVARPDPRSRFVKWTPACGQLPTCTVAAGPIASLRARFDAR
jgi:Divergent InlB B-repeat domain